MKRNYRHLHFFNKLTGNLRQTLSSTIIEQNRWLRIMQEEQPSLYEASQEFSTAAGSGSSEQDQAAFFEQNQ